MTEKRVVCTGRGCDPSCNLNTDPTRTRTLTIPPLVLSELLEQCKETPCRPTAASPADASR